MSSEEKKGNMTYTSYKIKFNNFDFISLDKLEIKKSIYEHSKAVITGVISQDNITDYEVYLTGDDPQLLITYADDDAKILFKGIIENYKFIHKNYDYYLELEALSYSRLLERKKNSRVYQNLGTTYNQVFSNIMDENPEFRIAFADESIGESQLVSEDYPVVLQYKETEWDFIKRLASYQNQILIVDDTKDDSETINILAGPHENEPQELNNVSGSKSKKTDKKNNIFDYYKIYHHEHYRSKDIFDIGKSVKYKLNNQKDTKMELIILKNRIYIDNEILCSDLTLAEKDAITVRKEKRRLPIVGRSFRAEVKQLDNMHRAQVQFLDIFDEYDERTAYYFPLDKPYTTAYLAPEIGDIVDVYFKSKNEKHATIKSSSTDNNQEVENDPADKIITTPTGYQIKINNELILISSKDNKSLVEIKEDGLKMISDKNIVEMSSDSIKMNTEKGNVSMDSSKTELAFGSKKIEITDSAIDMK
jgi:hypothetical protein